MSRMSFDPRSIENGEEPFWLYLCLHMHGVCVRNQAVCVRVHFACVHIDVHKIK